MLNVPIICRIGIEISGDVVLFVDGEFLVVLVEIFVTYDNTVELLDGKITVVIVVDGWPIEVELDFNEVVDENKVKMVVDAENFVKVIVDDKFGAVVIVLELMKPDEK